MNIETLLDYVKGYSSKDKELIIRAYEFASAVHKGVKRKSGEDYIIHPICVACILAEMHADADTISAGLLHDVIEDGENVTKETLTVAFNETVANLVDGVTKMKKWEFNNDKKLTEEANIRKLLQSITIDIRILIIKLADRLHNMRTLEFHTPEKQIENAQETMDLFVPFANFIGEYAFKLELEDLSFKYLKPVEYLKIKQMVLENSPEYRESLDEVVCTVAQMLNSNSVPFNIKVKVKNLYGIYERLKSYQDINDIHDFISIEILLNAEEECYHLAEQIKNMFKVVNNRCKDYIKTPKTNMYRSIHMPIISPQGYHLQFRIETPEMYKINSYGVTAYWNLLKHKNKLSPAEKMQADVKKFQFFQELEELVNLEISDAKFNRELKNNLLTKKIYVYTPKGQVVELPIGSTPVDFAFKIHTDIGNNIISAKVNGEYVPLNYQLQNEDVVQVYSNQLLIGPRLDYANLCKTGHAKRKIKEFRRLNYRNVN